MATTTTNKMQQQKKEITALRDQRRKIKDSGLDNTGMAVSHTHTAPYNTGMAVTHTGPDNTGMAVL